VTLGLSLACSTGTRHPLVTLWLSLVCSTGTRLPQLIILLELACSTADRLNGCLHPGVISIIDNKLIKLELM
jgi:hypothetical protein